MNTKTARKLYKKFFGTSSKNEFTIELAEMDNLTFLGFIDRLDYIAIKPKFGDKEDTVYMHKFKNNLPVLYNGKDLIIPDVKITNRGIES